MWRGVLTVLEKDLRIEWRTKESLASFVVLGVLLVVIFSVASAANPRLPSSSTTISAGRTRAISACSRTATSGRTNACMTASSTTLAASLPR